MHCTSDPTTSGFKSEIKVVHHPMKKWLSSHLVIEICLRKHGIAICLRIFSG